ncbi:hypothetical protein [Kitasatospora sp. SC0581]|uniref:hypothetical protein n=1 Tax=Kitasatospora sp. SC0581 TaxID=3394360 RepID=UPI003A8446BD
MSAEDRFEEELVTRLGTHAAGIAGTPPLAELHRAGRRRARRQAAVRGVTAAAVLVLGAGALTQLGGGGPGSDRTGAAGTGLSVLTPTAGATAPGHTAVMLNCVNGPTSMRTPGWHQHSSRQPWETPSAITSSGYSSSWTPPPGSPWLGLLSPATLPPGHSSSDVPSTGTPFSGLPSSSGSPSSLPTDSASGSGSGSGSPSSLSSEDPAEARVTRAGESIEALAMTDYPDHYFGTCRDRNTGTLYVMRVPGSGLDAAVTARAADWPTVKVRFADAAGSREQLMTVLNRIRADTEEWRARGVVIDGLTLAIDGTGVVVDTPQWQSAEADIKAKYGALVAEVR